MQHISDVWTGHQYPLTSGPNLSYSYCMQVKMMQAPWTPVSMPTMHGYHPSSEPLTRAEIQGQWAKICSPRSHITPCVPWRLEALSPLSRGAPIAGHGVSSAGFPNQVPQSQSEDDQRSRYGASPVSHVGTRKMLTTTALSCSAKCTSHPWHTEEWHHRPSRTAQGRSSSTLLTPRRQATAPAPTSARPSGTPRHTSTGQRP